jgi:hypothetical protein
VYIIGNYLYITRLTEALPTPTDGTGFSLYTTTSNVKPVAKFYFYDPKSGLQFYYDYVE